MGRFLPVKAHPVRWSDPMQTNGQVGCKWMVKSMQLRKTRRRGCAYAIRLPLYCSWPIQMAVLLSRDSV